MDRRLRVERHRQMRDRWSTARVEAFSDGVIAIELQLVVMGRYAAARADLMPQEYAPPSRPLVRRRSALSVAAYGIAILVGVLLLPEIAAFAFLAVAARSIFVAEGEVRLTFAPLRGDR